LPKNRSGTIKYVGPTALGAGIWYGIELDCGDGLHDGCLNIDGQRYFQCKPKHGVFVRGQNLKKCVAQLQEFKSCVYVTFVRLSRHERRKTSLERQQKRQSRMTASVYDATGKKMRQCLQTQHHCLIQFSIPVWSRTINSANRSIRGASCVSVSCQLNRYVLR
jgi:dynactin complex subunit